MKFTTYQIATHWLRNSLILCDDIVKIDEELIFPSDLEDDVEIYQFFLTDCSEADVEWLVSTFDLHFAYSPKLEMYVLCVTHRGTGWDYVACEVKDESWLERNPECEYKSSLNPPHSVETRMVMV